MKVKLFKLSTILMAVTVVATMFSACGNENPFLGSWDDDENETSIIFKEDGTGEQTGYDGSIEFTYTWEDDTVVITNEDIGVTAEGTLEDDELIVDDLSFVKKDSAKYTPENKEVGGSESELNGSWSNASSDISITFDGEEMFGFSNNEIGSSGGGTYTFDGATLIVTMLDDNGEEASYEGQLDDSGNITISLWGDEVVYYPD